MKSKILGIFMCLTLITFSTVTMASLKDGLVGYWPMDEGEGFVVADLSDNGNDGVLASPVDRDLSGEHAEWVTGKFGSALSFDGTDYVDCGNPSVLDFPADFTVSAWVKDAKSSQDSATFWSKGGDGGGGIRLRVSMDQAGTALFHLDDDIQKLTGRGSIRWDDKNDWRHIVAMRSGNEMRVYVDGVQDMAVNNILPEGFDLSGTSQSHAVIGAIWDFGGNRWGPQFWEGLIDEVAIWNRAITEEEIAELLIGSISSLAVESNGKLAITWGSIK